MELVMETLAKLGFDWKLALMNFFNVAIIFFILKRYLFGTVSAKIEERRKLIVEGVENAQRARTEMFMAEQKAQVIIDDAKVEANKIIEASVDEARNIAEKMKDKAKSEIELLVAQAKKNIEIDRQEMHDKLKEETVALVIKTATVVLGKHIDSKLDEQLIKDAITK